MDTPNAIIISTYYQGAAVVAGELAGAAKKAADDLKSTLLENPIHLPLGLSGVMPGSLTMADAPRFREGVGPSDQVLVPAGYEYLPSDSEYRLHDYCSYVVSWSFDTQFFGPCAKHDICIDLMREGDLEMRARCDRGLGADLQHNRWLQNPPRDRSRTVLYLLCARSASAMWAAVTIKGALSP